MLDSLEPTISNYLKALHIYEDLGPSQDFVDLLMQLGWINMYKGRTEYACKYMTQAKNIKTRLSKNELGPYIFFSLGRAKTDLGEYDSAYYYLNKATEASSAKNGKVGPWIYISYDMLYASQYYKTNDTVYLWRAISALEKALKAPRMDDNKKVTIYIAMAEDYMKFETEKHLSTSIEYLKMAERLADTSNLAYEHKDKILITLAWIFNIRGDYDRAIELCRQSLRFNEERMAAFSMEQHPSAIISDNNKFSHRMNKRKAYKCLYDNYAKLGDYRTAHEYYVLARQADDELYSKQNSDLLTMLEATSKDEKTKSQIDLLARDNELQALIIKQSRILILGIAGMFIILLLMGFLFIRQNRMKNEHKTVLLEQKLLRLQMNPHFIFNALSNILNLIDRKESEKASNYLTSFSKLLRTTLESTREDMIPFEKEVSSLNNYLELQKLRYQEKFDYNVEVDKNIEQEDMSIPPMLVQPFIENAIEHGIRHKKIPGRIDVRFFLKDKKILCEVEDDGIGREKAWETEARERTGHKSLATEIIRDRIVNLNKKFKQKIKLEIIDKLSENQEATGTKVLLDLPYGTVYE